MKKRFLAVLLCLCMTVGVLPVEVLAAEEGATNQGTLAYQTEEDVSNELPEIASEPEDAGIAAQSSETDIAYETQGGVLYFDKVTGTITDFDYNLNEPITLEIPREIDGTPVTAIGPYALSIGYEDLVGIIIPDSVTYIGDYAFQENMSLTSVTIPDSVTSMGEWVFDGCYSLTSVTLSNNITSIEEATFQACDKLTSVNIPNGITSIADYVFNRCHSLDEVNIPSNVTSIGEHALAECGFTDITIPDSVTSIGASAFAGSNLTSIAIPSSVISIGERAFSETGLTYVTIPESVTDIGTYVFADCVSLTGAKFPSNMTAIAGGMFSGCTALTDIPNSDYITSIDNYAFSKCTGLADLTIPENITEIGSYAFSGCDLTSLTIPASVTEIGDKAFSENDKLTSAGPVGGGYDYEFGWTDTIPSRAFAACDNSLYSVVIPGSITYVGRNAFSGCKRLKSAGPIGGDYDIQFGWTTEIPDHAFEDFTILTNVDFPISITSIGSYAFKGCGLTVVSIPANVTSIGNSAFKECNLLTSVIFPSTSKLTFIGDHAFAKSGLITMHLPKSVTGIKESAFEGCTELLTANIPNGVDYIDYKLFYNCSRLISVTIPASVDGFAYDAFVGTKLSDAGPIGSGCDYQYGWSEYIPGGAFAGCGSMTSVKIPNSITAIHGEAFFDCDGLTDVYYDGTEEEWKNVTIEEKGNEALLKATVHFTIRGTLKQTDGCTVNWRCEYHLGEDGQAQEASIRVYTTSTNSTEEELYIFDGTAPWELSPYNISKSAVTELSINGKAKKQLKIPANAFNGYSNLRSVDMENVSLIDEGAFSGCTALSKVDFPQQTLKSIGAEAFKGTNLGYITLDEAVTAIGTDAFSRCEKICIYCYEDSVAYQFAQSNGIPVLLLFHDKNKITVPFEAADKDISMEIVWEPEKMFSPAATAYNNDLAIAGLVLSGAAEKGQDRVDEVLTQMGFGQGFHDKYEEDLNIGVAYSLANRKITINKQTKTLVVCVVRGTTTIGDGFIDAEACVDGFKGVALTVKRAVSEYIDNFTGPGQEVILFTTGHSLGGAVSSLVGTWMSDEMRDGTVFSYNYATPRNKIFPYGEGDKRPVAVYNIINTSDKVPYVPPHFLAHVGKDRNYSTHTDLITVSSEFNNTYYKLAGCFPDLSGLWGEHLTDRYMALLLADEEITETEEFNHRLIKVLCPVDVEVVDSNGVVVARTKDNVADDTIMPDRALVYIQDDEKYIYLFDDGDYTIRMTGTDEGILNYSVEDVAADGSVLSEKEYLNVVLTPGKKLTSEVGGATDTPDVKLLVLGETGQPEKEVLPDGNGTEVPITAPGHTHNYGIEWKSDKDNHWHECSCGDKADVATHTPGEWIVDKTATATTDGSRHRACTVCGYVIDTEVIPAKGTSGGGSGGGAVSNPYAVSTGKTSNGKVSASPATAKKGDTVILTVTPDKGYALDKLTVTDKNGDQVKLTEKNGKYTFIMPAGKVDVKASFAEIKAEPVVSFTDVPTGAYYADAVAWAVENGVTGGTSAITFSPDASCTRAQAVTFLWRSAGSPVVNYAMNFTDVPADAYYAEAVRWAVSQGITSGTTATTFSPDATCTRGQIVTFLWRSQKSPAAKSANPFGDVVADAYYANAVLWALENGITAGTTVNTFGPNATCTRAQIVTFLFRCLGGK